MEDMRKWEEMPTDCLVNIFGRLPIESCLLGVSLVCKPWLQAVRNPFCWQKLIFQSYHGSRLIHFVINLSQRCATSLVLPERCSIEDLTYVTEECPALKVLVLPADVWRNQLDIFVSLIVKLKNLEILGIRRNQGDWISCDCILGIIKHVGIHLPNFIGLFVTNRHIDDDIASAIVSMLKHLFKHRAEHSKEDLFFIMHGFREPVCLHVRNSLESDEEGDDMFNFSQARKNIIWCDDLNRDISYEYDYYIDIYIMKAIVTGIEVRNNL